MSLYQLVKEFHLAYNLPVNKHLNLDEVYLRGNLNLEEYMELDAELADAKEQLFKNSIIISRETKERILKESCDLVYVVVGLCVAMGLPFDEAFKRVHESNMSKLGEDGKPIYRDDGKILKGPNYKKADLSDLV